MPSMPNPMYRALTGPVFRIQRADLVARAGLSESTPAGLRAAAGLPPSHSSLKLGLLIAGRVGTVNCGHGAELGLLIAGTEIDLSVGNDIDERCVGQHFPEMSRIGR